MKILFLCTAHNSLSQRLYLALSRTHEVSIEYALSEELMVSAVRLFHPDLIVCPFLTTLVPREIYGEYMTLIIHPGPPGDVGPSALDWVLMGDDGTVPDAAQALNDLYTKPCGLGRSHWAVTVLQAIEEFDAGPVWAFEQFEIDIDQPGLTKSELYRGAVTQSAVNATLAAISRIQLAPTRNVKSTPHFSRTYSPAKHADPRYGMLSVSDNQPFMGGDVHHRPLLKAVQRAFDIDRHSAQYISRRIRCGDSQPGVLSKVFGRNLFIYGGIIEDNADGHLPYLIGKLPSTVLGIHNQAVCISTCDGKGVWITHVRRPKAKSDSALAPKVPAVSGLLELGLLTSGDIMKHSWPLHPTWQRSALSTFQEVWVDWVVAQGTGKKTAYLYFDFYNGAMSTDQCAHLIDAMDYILTEAANTDLVQAVVLMGGSYFSNGIALNVIEAAADPSMESWLNINRIDDVVHFLLHEFPSRNIVTIAAIRGNAAAGGVALATACDIVVAGSGVVLNPAYRAIGLAGSEFHTLSYYGRCGKNNAQKILRSMTPISALWAQSVGLVDYVFPGAGTVLDDHIRTHVAYMLKPGILKCGLWKTNVDLSSAALARTRATELGEMSLDFFSARSTRYHSRRFAFVRKTKPTQTPLRFALHRRRLGEGLLDEEEAEDFDSVGFFAQAAREELITSLREQWADELAAITAKQSDHTPYEELPETPVMTVGERKMDLMFSCYYSSAVADLPTPPESPFGEEESMKFGILS